MLNLLRRISVGLLAVCAGVQIGSRAPLRASASGLVISQVYGAGGNAGAIYRNDFVELFNGGAAPVDLAGKSIQYASATGTGNFGASSTQIVTLSGTIQPGHYFLVQLAGGTTGVPLPSADATGTINMSASAGKVALVDSAVSLGCNGGSTPCSPAQLALIVDLVGFGGANFFETAPTAPLSAITAAIRNNGGLTDTDNNAADFTVGTPTPRNSGCTLSGGCPLPSNPVISAPAVSVVQGDQALLTAAVTPGTNPPSTGIVVTGDLTAIGGLAAQPFFDDGTNGDAVAGDNTFAFTAPSITQPGAYNLTMSAGDAQGRTAINVTLRLTVVPLVSIHDIQGPGTVSPFVGQLVATRGIVTGVKYNGFFIQTPDADVDADPNTSEGVFVFTSATPPPAAVVGNGVQVIARVSEYKNTSSDPDGLSMTELTSPTTAVLSTGNELPAVVVLTSAELNPGASIFALEKYEGMRVHVESVVATSPTDGSVNEPTATATSSGLFFGVLPGTMRPFREAGIQTPLPVPPEAAPGATPPVFDANPERIGVDTFSVFLDPATAAIYPPPPGTTLEITSGVTVANITGPLDYAYRSYIIDAEGWNMPAPIGPDMSVQPVRLRTNDEFTVATMNLARLYDATDDPVLSPNNEPVLTGEAFDRRLAKASLAILDVLKAPDIIGVEEVENSATLLALADRVYADSQGAVDYAARLEEGNDIGGIDVGFLVRKDKVADIAVEQIGKSTTYVEPGGATALLNDRPSLILRGAVQNPPYEPYPITVVVNHLRSMSGVDGSDGQRIRAKRLAQAVELAAKLQELQAAGEHVVSIGDYNAFDVNDGYVDVMGLLKGTEADPATVTLWAPSPVTPPLFDLDALAAPGQRYSFIFDGSAQELDHLLASADVQPNAIAYARMNADFPDTLRNDGTSPARISDHDPIVGYFVLPDIDTVPPSIASVTPSATVLWPPNGGMVPITIAVNATDAVGVARCDVTGVAGDDGSSAADWSFEGLTVNLAARRLGDGSGRTYTITVACTDAAGNVSDPATTTVFVPHDQRK